MKKLTKRLTGLAMALLMVVGLIPMSNTVQVLADTTAKVFDATTIDATGVADKTPIAEGTTYADGYFKIVGEVTQRLDSNTGLTKSVEVGKAGKGAIQFTTTAASNVVLEMSSTGGANTSAAALVDADGNVVANKEGITTVSATDRTRMTYENLPAGTYRVISPENAEYGRGARVYTITVTAESEGGTETAASTAEYLLDTTKLDATGVNDKDAVAEGTTYGNYFKVVGTVTQRTNSDGSMKCLEIGKALSGAIQFTTNGSADITLAVSSTGGSNTSEIALVDEAGNVIANNEGLTQVSTTATTTLTYTGLAAGTYRVVSPENAELNRGARVISVLVAEVSAAATTEYAFDSTTIPAAGVADKDPIAEGTTFADYYKVVGKVTQRVDAEKVVTKYIEVDKNLNGAIAFTVMGTADVVVTMSSTGGSNTSAVALIDEAGNSIANAEGITTVTGTDKTTMTYTGLTAGTYRIVSPESEYNRGARVHTIVTNQTSSGERPARAAWDTVAAPAVKDIATADGKITVSYKMVIGYDGADKVIVTMYDKTGTEADSASAASDGTEGSVSFAPKASGEYTFKITAVRDGEKEKEVTSKAVAFALPLKTPSITSATSVGNGGVDVVWGAVDEAEKYVVSYRVDGTADAFVEAATVTGTNVTVTGLTTGTKYEFSVQAVRGSETTERGVLSAEATKDAQRVWSFAAFGSSVSAKDNYYTGSANEGSVTVASVNGKGKLVPASTDGIAFYYTKINPETENFVLSATVTVDSWKFSNGQEGFGIMAADRVGEHGDGSTFWNNSFMAVVSKVEYYWDLENQKVADAGEKISMKLGIGAQSKLGVTAANIADNTITTNINELFKSEMTTLETSQARMTGTFNIIGNFENETAPQGTVPEKARLTTFKFTLERNNTGYIVSYTDKDGNTVSKKYYDLERNALTQIDEDAIYVGFFAARNATATFTDIVLTTSDPATDAPAEGREMTLVTPNISILSAAATGNEDYEVILYANADGVANIKNGKGEVIAENVQIKAETYAYVPTKLPLGATTFVVEFTPAAGYQPSEFEVLSSYDTFEYRFNTFRKEFAGNVIYVSPLVDSSTAGKGTKNSPTDINTAVKYAKPGQIILLDGGEYLLLTKTVTAERGNDGTPEQPIYLMANPEATERPVLNFQGNCAGMVMAGDYWILSGFDVTNSKNAQKGLQISGSHCIVQDVNAYNNGNTGIQISRYYSSDLYEDWPSYNLILNCTSYNNADIGYEDADGFAAKLTVGDGNVFDGCVAYHNADDGWDLFAKIESGPIGKVVIKNCVTYGNGYLVDGTDAGNGNGFKLGGSSISGYHELINCVSYDNKAKGIDTNSCPDIQITDCISFNNGSYNVALYTNDAANTDYTVNGVISFRTEKLDINEQVKPKGTQDTTKIYGANNYYYDSSKQASVNSEGAEVSADWFVSLDTKTALTRNADGTINRNGVLVLTDKAAANVAGAGMGTGAPSTDYSAVVLAAQKADEEAAPTPTVAPTKAPTEAPAEPTKAPDTDAAKDSTSDDENTTPAATDAESGNNMLPIVIVVIVVVLLAAVAAVFVVKKKGQKK
ncbi:MAG: fibronectin type III domain-containing protein [Lachnospiraceae bacterium]